MRFELGHNGQVTAGATFYGLVFLAGGLLAALSGFVSYFAPVLDACATLWENVSRWLSSPGVLLPLAVAASAAGMAGLSLFRQGRATRRLLRRLAPRRRPAPPRLLRIAREIGLEDRIDCIAEVLTVPFCYGFIRPRVCVPVSILSVLDDAELRAVLLHESHHARNRDPLKVWLSRALANGLFFLPIARDLRDSYLAAKEVAADEMTARGGELPLASALVKLLATAEPDGQSPWPGRGAVRPADLGHVIAAGLISITREPASDTEVRIRRLIGGPTVQLRLPSLTNVALSALIVVAIFAGSFAGLQAAPGMAASQECAAESRLLRADAASLAGYGSGSASEPTSCDLLTPTCR